MIIKHIPILGVNGETDTDKLPDIEAMLMEKSEEIRKICADEGKQCVILVDTKGKANGQSSSFWSLQINGCDMINNPEDSSKCYVNMLQMMNSFVLNITGGRFCVTATENLKPPQ